MANRQSLTASLPMSDGQEQVDRIAARIAARLDAAKTNGATTKEAANADETARDVAALRETLAEMQKRLAQLESHLAGGEKRAHAALPVLPASTQNAAPPRSFNTTYVSAVQDAPGHASQERFGIGEAVSELVDFFEREKICELEPGGKKCDHCAMCSARGF
jgi:hypothetical protein